MKKNRKNIELKKEKEADNEAAGTGSGLMLSGFMNDLSKDWPASRRDFLKLCGYSFAFSALASCKSKIEKAVPYAIAPVESTPGEALYYASTYISGNEYCSVLVKTREGRPIKIEGNPESGITRGGTTARVQASVLDLYDTGRFHGPSKDGKSIDWGSADTEITERLKKISDEKGTIVLLTPSIFSPSTEAVISGFLGKFKGSEWIEYDAISYSAMLEANRDSFGIGSIPDYRFDRADVIVSSGADFLGTWLSPVEYIKQFASRRDPKQQMNYLVQLESNLSLTGCNADRRITIKPSQESLILLNIYKEVLRSVEKREINVPDSPVPVDEIAKDLLSSPGKTLLISGTNDKQIQSLVNSINILLGNIGHTILFDSFLRTHKALDSNMEALIRKMKDGEVDALLIWNVNPAYTWYDRDGFRNGLGKVKLTVTLSGSPDETSGLVNFVCPDNHYLESWNDAEAKKNMYSLMQPAIDPVFGTRQMAGSLLKWSGSEKTYYGFLKDRWIASMMPRQTEFSNPVTFFDNTLQRGVFEPKLPGAEGTAKKIKPVSAPFDPDSLKTESIPGEGNIEVILYEPVVIGEGRQANNPWLQELPDPVTRICWDNFAAISARQAAEMGFSEGEVVKFGGFDLPVHIQPGQAYQTIGIALGYGRQTCGKVGDGVGTDVWQLRSSENGTVRSRVKLIEISKTGGVNLFAEVQPHHSMEGRAIVREASLKEFRLDPAAGNELHAYFTRHDESLYKVRTYPHHHWGMVIDLSKCVGCGTCVIACQAENNVPVVGKNEVHRVHEMQWMRIDRYFTGDDENPGVLFQPILCQHCENAPCENVCPVAATNHSSEGLNQMIYNRCFGTRYCNNNCPYKVRRFNWFNYTEAGTLKGNLMDKEGMTGDLRRMVLNPDVTVRAQGVIEKCSFCVQRIQAAKLNAKKENRALLTNEVQTACSQSCPANAILFGDMNAPDTEMNDLIRSARRYNVLEELLTKPSVNYLTKIRNKNI